MTGGVSYSYRVTALDTGDNESAPSGTVSATPTLEPTNPDNLVGNGSFEGGLSGWATWRASATAVAGGAVGSSAARVSFAGPGVGYAFTTAPRPVNPTATGSRYRAQAQVRSETPGRRVCLVLREWSSASTALPVVGSCVTASRSWQPFPPLEYTTQQSGGSLELYVEQGGAAAGDSLDLDDVTLLSMPQ